MLNQAVIKCICNTTRGSWEFYAIQSLLTFHIIKWYPWRQAKQTNQGNVGLKIIVNDQHFTIVELTLKKKIALQLYCYN